ncbi:MAG: hypothetical protein LW847_14930 [Burkholderiales bacterium]|jgi:hypothetical protein|nr:hypothetical protein [Burkholderiales bacterium]
MKTARLTLLVTPEFKSRLERDAERAGISVAQLVRERFETTPSPEEAELRALTAELRRSTATTRAALRAALQAVQAGKRNSSLAAA